MALRCSGIGRSLRSIGIFSVLLNGCDPSQDPPVWREGPAFLAVAQAAQQPETPSLGITVYLQGRGGNLVGIATRGGTHRYAELATNVNASCTVLPGSRPLYFSVQPMEEEMLVEARLYNTCDPPNVGDAAVIYNPCAAAGTPVTTTLVPIRRSVSDAGAAAIITTDAGLLSTEVGSEHFAWNAGSLGVIPECAQ